jgi:hypothetical protein
LSSVEREYAAEGKLLARIVVEFRQSERRIGEKKRAVGAVHEIVGTVQTLTFILAGEHGDPAVFLHARDPTVAMFVDRQPALGVER